MAELKCRNYRGVHIPGCWGCTIYGHDRCTCRQPSEKDNLDRIKALELRMAALEKRMPVEAKGAR